MATTKERMQSLMEDLQQQRDELRVKLNLAQAEARDEWKKMEDRWETFENRWEAKMDDVEDATEETADNVEAALELAAEELKNGYRRLRKLF